MIGVLTLFDIVQWWHHPFLCRSVTFFASFALDVLLRLCSNVYIDIIRLDWLDSNVLEELQPHQAIPSVVVLALSRHCWNLCLEMKNMNLWRVFLAAGMTTMGISMIASTATTTDWLCEQHPKYMLRQRYSSWQLPARMFSVHWWATLDKTKASGLEWRQAASCAGNSYESSEKNGT